MTNIGKTTCIGPPTGGPPADPGGFGCRGHALHPDVQYRFCGSSANDSTGHAVPGLVRRGGGHPVHARRARGTGRSVLPGASGRRAGPAWVLERNCSTSCCFFRPGMLLRPGTFIWLRIRALPRLGAVSGAVSTVPSFSDGSVGPIGWRRTLTQFAAVGARPLVEFPQKFSKGVRH